MANEIPPTAMLHYVAEQLDVEPDTFEFYARREETRREHIVHLLGYLEMRSATDQDRRAALLSAIEAAATTDKGISIANAIIATFRERRVLLPAVDTIELIGLAARAIARRGDAGKGFAVVAQEVRELAQRSAGAAKDIKALINRSGEEVTSGVKLVTATGEALTLIQGHVVKVNEHVHSIATAAKEQSTGLSEVNTAVNQMDQTTQQNAAMVEESTAATNRLADEAANLARLIARFKIDAGNAPRAAAQDNKPVASPARALGRKLAGAFGGKGAAAVAVDTWEEF